MRVYFNDFCPFIFMNVCVFWSERDVVNTDFKGSHVKDFFSFLFFGVHAPTFISVCVRLCGYVGMVCVVLVWPQWFYDVYQAAAWSNIQQIRNRAVIPAEW